MVYEAERLIDRRIGRIRTRIILFVISYVGVALLGAALTLAVVILIRKI